MKALRIIGWIVLGIITFIPLVILLTIADIIEDHQKTRRLKERGVRSS